MKCIVEGCKNEAGSGSNYCPGHLGDLSIKSIEGKTITRFISYLKHNENRVSEDLEKLKELKIMGNNENELNSKA